MIPQRSRVQRRFETFLAALSPLPGRTPAAVCQRRSVRPRRRPVTGRARQETAAGRRITDTVSELDERLDLERMRDLRGRRSHPWIRRSVLALLAVGVLVAATGAIGQPTRTLAVDGSGARLQLEAPGVLRGGLMWRARIVVRGDLDVKHPRLVLGPGFVHGMQLNTIEPSPVSEASRGPRVVLSYPELKAGDELVVYLQLQVNPTTVGSQDTSVELDDEAELVARVAHTTRVLP